MLKLPAAAPIAAAPEATPRSTPPPAPDLVDGRCAGCGAKVGRRRRCCSAIGCQCRNAHHDGECCCSDENALVHVVPPRLSGPASEPMRKPRRPAPGNSTRVVREREETGKNSDSNLAKYRRASTGRKPWPANRPNRPGQQAESASRCRLARRSSRRFALILGELMLSGSRPPQPCSCLNTQGPIR